MHGPLHAQKAERQTHECVLIDCKFEDSTCDLESLTRCWGPHSFSTGTLFSWTGATPLCPRSPPTPPSLICSSRKSQKFIKHIFWGKAWADVSFVTWQFLSVPHDWHMRWVSSFKFKPFHIHIGFFWCTKRTWQLPKSKAIEFIWPPFLSIINALPVCIRVMCNCEVCLSIDRCSKDQMTTMLENGDSQKARFYFPAFRFIEQQNETISTYYLHCITRLCERSTCNTFKVRRKEGGKAPQAEILSSDQILNMYLSLWSDPQQCSRNRRSVETTVVQESITEPSVLTVAIRAKAENRMSSKHCSSCKNVQLIESNCSQ